jgi:predicted alpha/beta superfamily hydrolase
VLGEERIIDVALPRGYETVTDRYPVIVVLDGEWSHEIATAAARFYAATTMMPPAIVVGVRNTNRTRDMTPAPAQGFVVPGEAADAGGADRFLGFLADELIPFTDSAYRTVPMRVLVGHSLGGLFALHALGTKPGVFTGYIVMEPATWWNDERELRATRDVLRRPEARRTRVITVNALSVGNDTTRWGGDAPMIRDVRITGETHGSMVAPGLLQAFRALFADFRPSEWRPGSRPVAMLLHYDSLAARVGYDVPIPAGAYERAIRMSIHARHFDDAEGMLARMERALGASAAGPLRELLSEERKTPVPAGLIPLVIPAKRPTPRDAARFIGTWEKVDGDPHVITVRASGDTIIVHDRIRFPSGDWDQGDHHVIQVTPNGVLEWGLPWFRGIAALLVLEGEILADGTMRVTREPRGWVPRGPAPEMRGVMVFRKVR